MDHEVFGKPVRVLTGTGVPREIGSAFEVHVFLSEVPCDRQDPEYHIARRACVAAMEKGGVDPETARAAFVRFAEQAGFLAPEVDDVVAAQAAGAASDRAAS